jgi:hypothetical protein
MPATARPTQAHSHAGGQAGAKPKLYNPRHPERTLLYQTIAEHFETWHALASAGQFDGQGDHHTPKPYVCQAFGKCLECGIFAHCESRPLDYPEAGIRGRLLPPANQIYKSDAWVTALRLFPIFIRPVLPSHTRTSPRGGWPSCCLMHSVPLRPRDSSWRGAQWSSTLATD